MPCNFSFCILNLSVLHGFHIITTNRLLFNPGITMSLLGTFPPSLQWLTAPSSTGGGTCVGWEPHTGRTPALHTCPTHTPAPRPQSPCNQLHGAPAGMATLQPGSHGWEQHKPPRFLFSTKASSHPTLLGVMGSISNIPFLLEDCYVSLLKELKLLKPLLNFQWKAFGSRVTDEALKSCYHLR